MRYRLIYVGLGLLGVAAIALGVVLSPDGDVIELPAPLQSVSPRPGDLVPRQSAVEIDLEVGYEAQITIDDWPITDATFVESTGVYLWAPSADHATITEWAPGEHTVIVVWNTYTGLPDTGSFEWTFRVG